MSLAEGIFVVAVSVAVTAWIARSAYLQGHRAGVLPLTSLVAWARQQAVKWTPARRDETQAAHMQRVEFEAWRLAGAELCKRVDEEMGNG